LTLFPLGLLTLTGNARRFETKRWNSDDTPEPIKKIAQIMIQQLNKRFKLEGIPDANTLLAMKLNPTVNKVRDSFVTMLVVFLTRLVGVVQEAVFSSSQRDAMNEAYDLLFNKTASFYFAKRQAEAEAAAQIARPAGSPSPARAAGDGTAAAAARAERPGANRTTGNVLADADAAFTLNLNDTTDADADDPANADLTDNRGVEKAAFAMMDKSEMKLGLAKGSFSVLRLYAHPAIRAKYPIHSILALVVYGAVQNEADCERVFAFSGTFHQWSGSRWDGYYIPIKHQWFVPQHDSWLTRD